MSPEQAATHAVAALTSSNARVEQGKTRTGDIIPLKSADRVYIFALQITNMVWGRIILISSFDDNLERAKALGADYLINYRKDPNWHRTAREIVNVRGVDQIIEIDDIETLNNP